MIQDSAHRSVECGLSLEDRRRLLQLARSTARRLLGVLAPEIQPSRIASAIPVERRIRQSYGGVFVTLWRGTTLRGCIGTLEPVEDLARVVPQVTCSALVDGRFAHEPILAAELPELRIEISLLSVPQRTHEPLLLIPGTHGMIVRRGPRSGCFLPKVAAERGWTAEEALRHCCEMKAGLPADAWCDPQTEVLLFTAETFSEGDAFSSG